MIDPGLQNKVVLVTGGNNPYGIGAATAKAFAAQGAKVFIQYLRMSPSDAGAPSPDPTPGRAFYDSQRAKSADEVVDTIRQLAGQIEAWETDLTNPVAIPQLFDRVEATFGPVDVVVNNAGGNDPDTFIPQSELGPNSRAAGGRLLKTITAESYEHNFGINSKGVALMMAEYARRHIERRAQTGSIINVSTNGASGFRTSVSYGAGKHAMESYSRAAASERGK
jgi:3-oxoacyl-[acyl-carrier protein] reductase